MNIIEQIKLRYDGYNKEQIKLFEEGYNKEQIEEIEFGKKSGIHRMYQDKSNSSEWMKVVRESHEHNLQELTKYFYRGEKMSGYTAAELQTLSSFFLQARHDGVNSDVVDYFSYTVTFLDEEGFQHLYDKHKDFKNMENIFKHHEENIFNELEMLNNVAKDEDKKHESTFLLNSTMQAEISALLKQEDVVDLTINAMDKLAAQEENLNIKLPYGSKIMSYTDYEDLSHIVIRTELTKEKYYENSIVRDLFRANQLFENNDNSDYANVFSIEKAELFLDTDTAKQVIENAKNEFFNTCDNPIIRFPGAKEDFEFYTEDAFVVRNEKTVHLGKEIKL